MLLGSGNVEKMWSVQLFLGVLAILTMTVYIPSTRGEPFLLQDNRVLPEREDTNHEETLLTLLLNKKLAWRRPENTDWELAKKFEELEKLEKLKDQLSTEEGSEVAYALESLSASQPKKRGHRLPPEKKGALVLAVEKQLKRMWKSTKNAGN